MSKPTNGWGKEIDVERNRSNEDDANKLIQNLMWFQEWKEMWN